MRKNCFPSWVIDKIIHSYVSKKMNPSNGQIDSPSSGKTHFYKLPYVGQFSKIVQTKLRKLLKRYCKADLDVKLVFSTFKLRNMFSVKDLVPQSLRSRVVYKFLCAGCNASYIGETTRHICARVREHLLSDKSSHVHRHLQSSRACHDSSLRSRRKRGRGARTREKNGGLGARDEGTPATKTPIFSFLRPPAAAKF